MVAPFQSAMQGTETREISRDFLTGPSKRGVIMEKGTGKGGRGGRQIKSKTRKRLSTTKRIELQVYILSKTPWPAREFSKSGNFSRGIIR